MMDVLVTGARGYVGSRFVSHALMRSGQICTTSIVRTGLADNTPLHREIEADIRNTALYRSNLLDAEYVVWFAALRDHFASAKQLNAHNVIPVREALSVLGRSKRLKRFLYISSISAVDNTLLAKTPVSDSTLPAPTTSYGRSKLEAETAVRDSGLPYSIMRLPFMYGSNYKPRGHLWLWEWMSAIPYFQRISFPGRLSLLHVDDLGEILVKIILKEIDLEANSTVLLADESTHKINHILDAVQGACNRPLRHRSRSVGSHMDSLMRLIPWQPVSYWSRALFDANYFVLSPSSFSPVRTYDYMSLKDGMRETYRAKQSAWQLKSNGVTR